MPSSVALGSQSATVGSPRRFRYKIAIRTPQVLEQQRLGGDGADAAGAKELREGDQQVDGKDDDFSRATNLPLSRSI